MVQNLSYNLCESLVENIGGVAGSGKRTPPVPITYLTQWKLMGNSEVHGQEIWSCGEYSAVDNKWHIRILPEGYGIVDIALDEPLRKVNDVADNIEYADGVATLTRNFASADLGDCMWTASKPSSSSEFYRMTTYSVHDTLKAASSETTVANLLTSIYNSVTARQVNALYTGIAANPAGYILIYDENYNQSDSADAFKTAMAGVELIYELNTPTTETIQAPQIQEADSYSCVISQGAKAVSWSDFETT